MGKTKVYRHGHDIIGAPKELGNIQLPTVADVLQCFIWERERLKQELGSNKDPSAKDVAKIVAEKVKAVWVLASIKLESNQAIVSDERIVQMIMKHHSKVRELQKSSSKGLEACNKKVTDFQKLAKESLFDIAACKCVDPLICKCTKTKRIPQLEVPFLLDQRLDRKMYIGPVDKAESSRRVKHLFRKQQDRQMQDKRKRTQSAIAEHPTLAGESGTSATDTGDDSEYECPKRIRQSIRPTQQMRLKLPTFSTAVSRTRVSNRSAALLASSLMEDLGVITADKKDLVIDHNKVDREKQVVGKQVSEESSAAFKDAKLRALYFDGRQDNTLTIRKDNDKTYRSTEKEEHIVLLQEPGSKYLGHVTPASGRSNSITRAIVQYCAENAIDLSDLDVVGCDGTAVNTGYKNGIMAHLEDFVQRPLQRCVCILHSNELPFRHLFQSIDGKSTRPTTYSGPIGTLLQSCESLPLKQFQPIPVDWIHQLEEVETLSTDQQYLLDICRAVSNGQCSSDLAKKKPGKMHQARWFATASRILRLYVSTDTSGPVEDNIKSIALYVMTAYAPTWFAIRRKPSIAEGARHLWTLIQSSRALSETTKSIIDPVIRRNSWFSHSENLLLAMITDENRDVRELGWRRILKSRDGKTTKQVRDFRVPKNLNFDGTSYIDMINWSEVELTEPPLTKRISLQDLRENVKTAAMANEDITKFPCHTQNVERMVKLVTEAASSVCGPDARHKLILTTLKSRQQMPTIGTKSSYKTK